MAIVRGNEAAAWSFDVLPLRLREAVAASAAKSRLSIADHIETICEPWQPECSPGEIADSSWELARCLRTALLPALQRQKAPTLTKTDRVRLGLKDYKKAFGHEITERHWQRLLERTVARAGNAGDFQRLELYLPEKPQRKIEVQRLLPGEGCFAHLRGFIQAFANPTAPTTSEKAALWCEVFELFRVRAKTRREQRQLRGSLVRFLFRHISSLAASQHALRVSFDRKLDRWQHGGTAALLDGRELKRGVPTAEPIPQADIDKLVWHSAANCGGRVAQAVREHAERGRSSGLTPETVGLITRPHTSKSQVNRRLASQLVHEVRGIMPFLLGKKSIDDATAHLERDYSKLASMQCVFADDFTMPVYFYVPDGNGWFNLTRGQCLLMLDSRSWKVIAWSLQPERNYNSLVIRTLMNRVCAGWGIPSTWYFERGIWKSSRLVKGDAPTGWQDTFSLPELRVGWENHGVRFIHATRARTKPVERVGGLLQDLMHGGRGYCGRDERRDCPEATKRAMDDVKFHRVSHPSELFLSFDEWNDQLAALIDRYNAASQDGTVLEGLSPDEAFEQFWPRQNPPARMDATCWHLVAHYVKAVPVTTNGICFRVGSKKFVYRNERTGQDRGKTVKAWFDPECPDQLCVTDLNSKNPYLVERSNKVDFLAEHGDQTFERELAKANAHSVYPRARFHVLKARFQPTFRRNLVDSQTSETAQEMLQQRTNHKQETSRLEKTRKAFRRLGAPMPAASRLPSGAAEKAAELERFISGALDEKKEDAI